MSLTGWWWLTREGRIGLLEIPFLSDTIRAICTHRYRTVAQAFSLWPVAAEARDRFHISPCEIFGGQNGIGGKFSSRYIGFFSSLCKYHSTTAPYSFAYNWSLCNFNSLQIHSMTLLKTFSPPVHRCFKSSTNSKYTEEVLSNELTCRFFFGVWNEADYCFDVYPITNKALIAVR